MEQEPLIVTHISPDFDAIASCWLLQRYGGLAGATVVFTNTGNPDPVLLVAAVAVVDTGRVLEPQRLRFDHHQLPGQLANEASAALLVYNWLSVNATSYGQNPLAYLAPLVQLISAGDTGHPAANPSRELGIHALLSAKKQSKANDWELLAYGYELLDALAGVLKARKEARASLERHLVYRSEDGLLWAFLDAPPGATHAAYEEGARVVCFQYQHETPEGTSYAMGAWRGGEGAAVHLGELVERSLASCGEEVYPANDDCPLCEELRRWYRHEAGFFAGRGTQKAPCQTPITVSLADVARALDDCWQR